MSRREPQNSPWVSYPDPTIFRNSMASFMAYRFCRELDRMCDTKGHVNLTLFRLSQPTNKVGFIGTIIN